MIDVSIITVNYNNSQLTQDFVLSIIKHTSSEIKYEIIVVDNCSEVDDYRNLLLILEGLKVNIVRSNINTGFGGGNMYGYQYATGEYVAFINNDVIHIEDCFSSILPFMKKNKNVGLATPQQINNDDELIYSYDYYHGIRRTLFGSKGVDIFKKIKRTKTEYTSPLQVDFTQGCWMVFDSLKFNEIGGFDTNLFLYFEEMDISYRLKQKNYLSYFVPDTKFKHLESVSIVKNYEIKKELTISRLYILKKNHNYLKYSFIRFYFLIKWVFKSIFKPKYFEMVWIIITGAYLSNSLKHKQQIRYFSK